MKILITGSTGFLGNALINELIKQNFQIYALTRSQSRIIVKSPLVNYIEGDLLDFEDLTSRINELNCIDQDTIIIHAAAILGAAQSSKGNYMKINVEATTKLLKLAIDRQVKKFVFISSMGAAGPHGSKDHPMIENLDGNPRSYYSKSKLQAEKNILNLAPDKLDIIIIRPPLIYGPGMNPKSGSAFIFKQLQKKLFPIIGKGNNFIDLIYIDNLVNGIITLMLNSSGHEIFFISDEDNYILSELIVEIKSQFNTNPKIIKFPYFLLYPLAWVTEKFGKLIHRDIGFNIEFIKGMATNTYHFSIDKAKKAGYTPKVPLQEGIRRTIKSL